MSDDPGRSAANIFDLWNEADTADVKPQARGMVFNDDEWHNNETAPDGVAIRMQVAKLTVGGAKSGSTEFKVRFKDVSGGDYDGRQIIVKKYLSNKVGDDGKPSAGTLGFNKRTMQDLMVLGLTKDFMSTRPSFETMGELVSSKGAVVDVFPFWEIDGQGRAWSKLDSYWLPVADDTQTDLDDIDDEEF